MFRLKHWLLPLLIVAFTAVAVTFLRPVFTLTVRWSVLCAVGFLLVLSRRFVIPLKSGFVFVLFALVAWCIGTTAWSEVSDLSLMKSGAFCLVVLISLAAGNSWVKQHSIQHALSFLLPLVAITTVAAVSGRYSTGAIVKSGPTVMYQGLVDGPNMFGSMLAMCTPVLAWNVYYHWANQTRRTLWLGLSVILAVFLVLSGSRASAIVAGFCVMGMLCAISPRKRVQIVLALFAFAAFGLTLSADLLDRATKYVYKKPDATGGLFATRVEIWERSMQQAVKGGLVGGGYGVTIGDKQFRRGLTSIGYGREKGNSQLAIIEETGVVGLTIYLIVLVSLFRMMARCLRKSPPGAPRVMAWIVTGTLAGMTAQSIFEAWWVAPGSPESLYFWVIVGIAVGLNSDPRFSMDRQIATSRRSPSEPSANRGSALTSKTLGSSRSAGATRATVPDEPPPHRNSI